MGSSLSVLLGINELLNLSLFTVILIEKYISNYVYPSMIIGVILYIVFILGIKQLLPPILKPYSYLYDLLPDIIKIVLPAILMLYLLKTYNDYGMLLYIISYLSLLYTTFFSTTSDFDWTTYR